MIANRSAPSAAIVPILIYPDVNAALEWLCDAFGFRERLRSADRRGVIGHAQIVSGAGDIMLGRAGGPYTAPGGDRVNQYVLVAVEDVNAHFEHARARGARIIQPLEDMPFGTRHYTAADPAGHWWTFSQNVADVAPESWGAVLRVDTSHQTRTDS
jgi:uncharacterized glyoxalase superfamily protein PhnB